MKKIFNNFDKGFSLVEIIFYLAIFATLSILVINSFIVILSSYRATNSNRNLIEGGLNVMEKVTREIRIANNINLTNTSSTILELETLNEQEVLVTTKIISENGDLNLYQDGVLKGNLLTNNVDLTYLFFRIISTPQGQAIKIDMTLEETSGRTPKSENFYNTIILRGGY